MSYRDSSHATGGTISFPAVFLIGTTAIILCRLLSPNAHLGTLFAAAVAVAVVFLLGLHSYRNLSTGDALSRAGDDLYYLGLLFTLVSLIYALVVLFVVNDRETELAERTYELIGSFGIALLSTVAGILGRVILHSKQRHETLENRFVGGTTGSPPVEYGPLTDLDLFARRLRAELRDAADAFSHFNRITMGQAQDTRRHGEDIVKEFAAKLRDDAQATVVQVEDAYGKLVDRVEATTGAVERRVGDTADALATLVEQFGSTASSFTDVSASAARTQRAVETLEGAVVTIADNLSNKASDTFMACETLARNIREHSDILEQAYAQTRATITQTEGSYRELSNQVAATTNALEVRITATTNALTTLVEGLGSVNRSFSELPLKAEQTQRGIEALGAVLKITMDTQVPELALSAERIRIAFAAVDEAASVLETLLKRLGSLNQSLTDLLVHLERKQPVTGSSGNTTATPVLPESGERY